MIAVQCPRCRASENVTSKCVLLEVGSGGDQDERSSASWICGACHELVGLPIDLTVLISLVAVGASVLDTALEDALPARPEKSIGGPRFTRDDLLDFHERLEDDAWLSDVTAVDNPAHDEARP
jgi:hypothetical protein